MVLVSYPLISTGLANRKLRPALVVSSDSNNRRLPDVILVPLTSKTQRPLEPTHLFLSRESPEGRQAGIRLDSVVKAETILTLPKALICKTIGHLPRRAMGALDRCLTIPSTYREPCDTEVPLSSSQGRC